MKYPFHLDKNKSSFYIKETKDQDYIKSTKNIETNNNSILLNQLLKDFDHSSETEIKKHKKLLINWLKKLDSKEYLTNSVENIRHLIYEMF